MYKDENTICTAADLADPPEHRKVRLSESGMDVLRKARRFFLNFLEADVNETGAGLAELQLLLQRGDAKQREFAAALINKMQKAFEAHSLILNAVKRLGLCVDSDEAAREEMAEVIADNLREGRKDDTESLRSRLAICITCHMTDASISMPDEEHHEHASINERVLESLWDHVDDDLLLEFDREDLHNMIEEAA